MKVKVFNFGSSECDDIEKTINQWLKTRFQATLHFITQSESLTEQEDGGITVIVWYVDGS